MRPSLRFLLCLLPSLALAAILPIYPRVTMTRSQVIGHAGDVIDWGFELCSLPGFFDDFHYMGPEQHPTLNLIVVLLLAALIASALAFGASKWWARRPRR
jgi:hypothetical protein